MESDLHKQLKSRAVEYLYDKSCWIVKPEVDCGYYGRYDVWGIKNDQNLMTYGIEVKVSKADFRNNRRKECCLDNGCDLNLDSHIPANLNYILCPEGLIKPEEIHRRYGLLWFNGERLVSKKTPLFNEMSDRRKVEVILKFLSSRQNNNPLMPQIRPHTKNST